MIDQELKIKKQKYIAKSKYILSFICIFNLLFLIFTIELVPQAQAFTMSNGNWIIRMGDFTTSGGQATGKDTKLTSSVGQTGPGLYTGKNFKVKAGFGYAAADTAEFIFSISDVVVNFGLLTATNPVTRTSTVTISNPLTTGYQVVGYQDHPLVNATNIPIPDTTCDNGSWSETTSAPWNSSLTYGFGYRCDPISNITCSSTFSEPDTYRKFSNLQKNQSPQTIIIGKKSGRNRKAKITYKVNISGTQMAGIYNNGIIYIAAPTY